LVPQGSKELSRIREVTQDGCFRPRPFRADSAFTGTHEFF
jgi:hypothetical protein